MQLRHTLLALAVASAAFGAQAADSVIGNVQVDGTIVDVSDLAGAVIGKDDASSVIVSGKSDALWLQNSTDDVTLIGTSIGLSGTRGIATQDGAKLTIGNGKTKAVLIKPTGTGNWGVFAWKKSSVTINTDILAVEVGEGSFGLHAQNNTQLETPPEGSTKLIVNAGKTVVKSGGIGLSAYSNGYLEVNGDLQVDAPTAVNARGYSTININQNDTEGKHTVVLNGNIEFTTPGPKQNSGDVIDANVNINLTNAASSWTGALVKDWPSSTPDDDVVRTSVTGFNLTLANGATWNATETPTESNEGTSQGNQARYQAVNHLTLNDGVINLLAVGQEIQIENLAGTGGTVTLPTKMSQSGLSSAKLTVDNVVADKTPTLTVNYDGNVTSYTEAKNQKLDAFESLTAMNVLAWRHDMNNLTKRLGELRDTHKGTGSWVRAYGSEQEYGAQNLKTKSQSVQVGLDKQVSRNWTVGGALGYTEGDTSYAAGSADNKSYSGAIYTTWLGETGAYADFITKYTRMESDFTLNGFSGSTKNDTVSASLELGWNIPFANGFFVEPQVEATYGHIFGDKFEGANSVVINQKDFDTLVGRAGVRAGMRFKRNRGIFYIRVSGAKDLMGETEFTARNAVTSKVFKTKYDDQWVEYALGINYRLSRKSYFYADVERTDGGDVTENYRWNAGIRFVW